MACKPRTVFDTSKGGGKLTSSAEAPDIRTRHQAVGRDRLALLSAIAFHTGYKVISRTLGSAFVAFAFPIVSHDQFPAIHCQ